MLTAYFFQEQFRNELFSELKISKVQIRSDSEGFVLVAGSAQQSVWAQQVFSHCEILEFQSIGEAAKRLQEIGQQAGKGFWVDCSVSHHRRASLIGEKLRVRKSEPIQYLQEPPKLKAFGFCLLNQSQILVSTNLSTRFPRGEFSFHETKEAPSRAYLKLWELFSLYSIRPQKGELCLDMGSCPGGWTWVLANLGCRVLSVDKAPLDPIVAKNRLVTSVKKDAFTLDPKELTDKYGAIDWFFSDIICEPHRLLELIENWREQTKISNFVCTVKFKAKTDLKTLDRLLQIPGSRAFHLFHNKHEVTWVLLAHPILDKISLY